MEFGEPLREVSEHTEHEAHADAESADRLPHHRGAELGPAVGFSRRHLLSQLGIPSLGLRDHLGGLLIEPRHSALKSSSIFSTYRSSRSMRSASVASGAARAGRA